MVVIGVLAWRLGQGPIDLSAFIPRFEQIANGDGEPTRLRIGGASLFWGGFTAGAGQPVELLLTDLTADGADGTRVMEVPRALVGVSFEAMLTGRLRARVIELDHPRLRATRAVDGTLSVDLGTLAETATDEPDGAPDADRTPFASLLAEITNPAATDAAPRLQRFSQLRRLRVADAALTVIDRQLGLVWRAPSATINLNRRPRGGVNGEIDVRLDAGEASARLTATVTQADGGRGSHVEARLTPVRPASLARSSPAMNERTDGALLAIDAPISVKASADFGPDLRLTGARALIALDAGTIAAGAQKIPVGSASAELTGDLQSVVLQSARLVIGGHDSTPPTSIAASGTLSRGPPVSGTVKIDMDRVAIADLPALWPAGLADHARDWVLKNMTAGSAHDAHVEAAVQVLPDWSDALITRAGGTIDAEDVTLWWLRPVPPVEGVAGRLTITNADTLDVSLSRGKQMLDGPRGFVPSGISSHSGHVRLTGIAARHQFADIAADLTGPLADAITLLKNKRLKLFDRHPVDLRDPAGQVAAHLTVHLPLENNVSLDDIPIHANGRADGARLAGIAGGRDLTDGAVAVDVTNDGLHVDGRATIAGFPTKLGVSMDFRSGPASQPFQTVTLSGKAEVAELARRGLDPGPLVTGAAGVDATYIERRDGRADVQATLDLTQAALTTPIGWSKPAGSAATGVAHVRLDHGHVVAVDGMRVSGAGIDVSGSAVLAGGGIGELTLDRIVLGRTQATGRIKFPAQPAGQVVASVSGPVIDLSGRLTHKDGAPTPARQAATDNKPGPPWAADLSFDTALMAHDRPVSGLRAHAENDGRVIRALRLDGRTGARDPFHLDISSVGGARALSATASDAGALLRAFDLVGSMQGGVLTVRGKWDDTRADHPLSGTAEIAEFRLIDAPAIGRLLQGLSLYGLIDLMRGPGLGFTKLVAPFTLTENEIELTDARAFSASLGITARGRVDLDRDTAAIEGTVIPSYALNTLPGRIPVIGKLFSPEKSGGLFAASFTVQGKLADPQVSVNPLSALAPGMLRKLFSGF